MGYIHVEIEKTQLSKKLNKPSGDVIGFHRNESATTIFLADGIGSGLKANIFANMCVSRIKELLNGGFSLRRAFGNIVQTMEKAKRDDLPYSAFTVMRVLNDGITTILSYEMPSPIFVTKRNSYLLPQRIYNYENGIIGEVNCFLKINEGVLLTSDGITQAGLGKGLLKGWAAEGVNELVNFELSKGSAFDLLPGRVVSQAKVFWKDKLGDDLTALLAFTRKGRILNIISGPPADKSKDAEFVRQFLDSEGVKIVCGGTTAKIVANYLGKKLYVKDDIYSNLVPPTYELEGIDLVTEGAVTLNQVFNIWGEDFERLEKNNAVTELYLLLTAADRVNFFEGKSENEAKEDIAFTQMRILRRSKIIQLISQKLIERGALVVNHTN